MYKGEHLACNILTASIALTLSVEALNVDFRPKTCH